MKKILITGVGGNVGRYIGDDLADAGYEVVGVYRNKIPMGSNYILIQADLSKHFSGGEVLLMLTLSFMLQQPCQEVQEH